MSNFGLQCFNIPGGLLTFTADAPVYSYLGKATFVSMVQAGTSPSGAFNGFSTYTFNWAGDMICAVGVPVGGGQAALIDTTQSGSTWTITIYHSSNFSTNTFGFETQTAGEVFVFGKPPTSSASSGFGLAIYDAAGHWSGDLVSKNPIVYKALPSIALNAFSTTMTGVVKPAFFANPIGYQSTSVHSTPIWKNRIYNFGWSYDGSSSFQRVKWLYEYYEDDAGFTGVTNLPQTDTIIIEANGLT